MYTSENNWYGWKYGDLPLFSRQHNNLEFKTVFGKYTGVVRSFKEELHNAARSTMDHAGCEPTILYSGGVDSEVMLRSFIDIGASPSVLIARYENDYNVYDVSYAVVTCEMLNIPYKIIDFSLKKFYENDAVNYAELAQIDRPRALPYCKLLELVDGFPIMGASDMSPYRTDDDYGKQGTWLMRCWEHDIGWSKFLRSINKHGIAEWFKWTPGLVVSYMKTEWFNNLTTDQYYGKLGSNSTKIIGYREAYPSLIDRTKKTGFEHIDTIVAEVETELAKKFNGLPYRNAFDRKIQDLLDEIQKSA
jgi:hypothetical protein